MGNIYMDCVVMEKRAAKAEQQRDELLRVLKETSRVLKEISCTPRPSDVWRLMILIENARAAIAKIKGEK